VMEFIAFMIVGYVEISPGECQIDYFRYNEIHSLVIPCQENGTLQRGSVGMLQSITYSKP
jgi:hypothetical protein